MRRRRLDAVTVVAAILVLTWTGTPRAQVCGDADGSNGVTVTDGVQVLRAAADLSNVCSLSACDVDGSGEITVSDGVNVLREAAGLSVNLSCIADAVISSVQGDDGIFGSLTKLPHGLTAPPGAAQTITHVAAKSFAEGHINTITVDYHVDDATAQAAAAAGTTPSLIVASTRDSDATAPAAFDLPLKSAAGTVTVALDLRSNLSVEQFTLNLANGAGGSVVGQVTTILIIVLRGNQPDCGNRVLDSGETCDPPGFGCAVGTQPGFCNTQCACEPFPGRYVDTGDGTITDTQTHLQWEKKTGTATFQTFCDGTNCPDPHDVNNAYQWCLDANGDRLCDLPGNPRDGAVFSEFLRALNTDPCFAGHCDWRLPTVGRDGGAPELETIVDLSAPGCGNGGPCIDPIFGPTELEFYWTDTTFADGPTNVWSVLFKDGFVSFGLKSNRTNVRAVRDAS